MPARPPLPRSAARAGAIALLLCGAAAPSALADRYPRQPGIDVLHYVFELTLRDDHDGLRGTARVRLLARTETREVTLDLVSEAGGRGMTVDAVEALGRGPLPFRHHADRLAVGLDPPVAPGSEVTLVVRYGGVPADGFHVGPNKFGERVFFSDSWPDKARHWIPAVDHPYDKATGEIEVTAPAAYQVVANGRLVEEEDRPEGMRRTRFRQGVPISTWLFALGVARFSVRHAGLAAGVPLESWVFPQDREVVAAAFEEPARSAAELFAARIGPYPYEKLANVQAIGFQGGIEHASAIFYDQETVTSRPIESLVAHEVAHQWWGNSVTERDWNEVWLSEGFATYFALLWIEHAKGRDAFREGLRRSRDEVIVLEGKLPGTPVIHPDLDDMGRVLNGLVYQKGAFVLHMLRRELGDPAFFGGLRAYYAAHAGAHATTEDLRRALEAASGRDLSGFFAQWLRRSGLPRLEGSWRHDAARAELEIAVEQVQAGEPYRLVVELEVRGDAGEPPQRHRVDLSGREGRLRVPRARAPREVAWDPDAGLLAEMTRLRRIP